MKRRSNVPRLVTLGAGVVVVVMLLVGVSPAAAEIFKVEIKGLLLSPVDISANVGDTVEWTNQDFVLHSATARDHQWDVSLPVHGVGRVTLDKPGSIEYYCRFHPNMKGNITVK